ncbi:MAG: hypothetical protein AAFX50_17155 [Acidobacteriota bacterium]
MTPEADILRRAATALRWRQGYSKYGAGRVYPGGRGLSNKMERDGRMPTLATWHKYLAALGADWAMWAETVAAVEQGEAWVEEVLRLDAAGRSPRDGVPAGVPRI